MHEDERPDSQRPAQQNQHFEEARVSKLQTRDVADEIDAEQWIDDRLDRKRNELQGLKGFVGKRVQTDFGERPEVLEDRHVGPKVEVGQKERECEGQRERKPATHETKIEVEADSPQVEDPDDDQ